MMIAYCVCNIVTDKRYIGVTTTPLPKRWTAHLSRARRGTKTALYGALDKYGPDAFSIEPIASAVPWADIDGLFDLERALIAQEGTLCPRGYNMTEGGDGTIGYRYTPEQRAAISGRRRSAETRAKMSASHQGFRHTPESIAKLKASRLGKGRGPRPQCRGKKLTTEHCAKLRARWTPERRAAQARRMAAVSAHVHQTFPRDENGRFFRPEEAA